MKKTLILAILIISSNLIFAQFNPKKCITTDLIKEELKNNVEYELMRQNLINYQKENKGVIYKNQSIITIPVVVHVVHRTQDNIGANTNISVVQIEDQLKSVRLSKSVDSKVEKNGKTLDECKKSLEKINTGGNATDFNMAMDVKLRV